MSRQYVPYDATSFGSWLAPHPNLRWAWAIVVLGLITIYVLATIAFGVRFSNLTHRGILTNGPYRYTKHPAYVSKNISWWMVSVPFLLTDGNPLSSIKRCIALGIINFMYFMRARTEERHLSRDPVYVAYAAWMNDHGVLRFLNRIPIFRYKPPAAKCTSCGTPSPFDAGSCTKCGSAMEAVAVDGAEASPRESEGPVAPTAGNGPVLTPADGERSRAE